jgi:Family of unknown function (DUF6064)
MSEWWTYSLSDFLLFSPHTYYRLFELYNAAIWPAQLLALALGLAILVLLRAGGAGRDRIIAALLAAAWLWVAGAYLLERYNTINWAARYFAVGFAIEALLLIGAGLVLGRLRFRPAADASSWLGLGLFLFALLLQPLIGLLVGRPWMQLELFAIAPDPTAIGTLGLLLTAAGWVSRLLLVIPLIWCAITGLTLWTMASPDALVVPAAALLVLVLAAWNAPSRPRR